ncbi:MAG: helix-turn-helix transcriptional regulator, partial [Chloroflexi bacterium]|nr:helix-turn-helix transcriptional regulator [Chloroflexota bacterium]
MVQRLRDARIARGLSIVDVERDTRINRGYIDDIEEARFEELPAPVYARGFVRSYARYLGLDPADAVGAMPQDL